MNSPHRKNLTLLEIMMATLVFSLAFIPLSGMMSQGIGATNKNNEETTALNLCRTLLGEAVDNANFPLFRTALLAADASGNTPVILRDFRAITMAGGNRPLCPTAADNPPGDYLLAAGQSSVAIKGVTFNFELNVANVPVTMDYLKNPDPDATAARLWYPFPTTSPTPPPTFLHTPIAPANLRYVKKDGGGVDYNFTNPVTIPDIVFLRLTLRVFWTGKDKRDRDLSLVSFKGDLDYDCTP